jgi:hypothetical protein
MFGKRPAKRLLFLFNMVNFRGLYHLNYGVGFNALSVEGTECELRTKNDELRLVRHLRYCFRIRHFI